MPLGSKAEGVKRRFLTQVLRGAGECELFVRWAVLPRLAVHHSTELERAMFG